MQHFRSHIWMKFSVYIDTYAFHNMHLQQLDIQVTESWEGIKPRCMEVVILVCGKLTFKINTLCIN